MFLSSLHKKKFFSGPRFKNMLKTCIFECQIERELHSLIITIKSYLHLEVGRFVSIIIEFNYIVLVKSKIPHLR